MTSQEDTEHLTHLAGPLPTGDGPLCLLVVHNERGIVEDLFHHLRAFHGLQFIAIDDHSTDGTTDWLLGQPDVALFAPKPGSEYRTHKRQWRAGLLDRFGSGRWCMAPDADERLVWHDFENRDFSQLLRDLENEGAEALVADMIDMYDDRPLADHVASPSRPLIEQFPYFDDPMADPLNYRSMMVPSARFRAKFPTPQTESYGGMRDRLFAHGIRAHGPLGRVLLKGSITRPRTIPNSQLAWRKLEARLLKPRSGTDPLVITKLALVKWRAGMFFSGGAHHLSRQVQVSQQRAALLHFPITKGLQGINYIASRSQHASGSKYYKDILHASTHKPVQPMYWGSKRYTNSRDLGRLLIGPPKDGETTPSMR